MGSRGNFGVADAMEVLFCAWEQVVGWYSVTWVSGQRVDNG